MNRRQISIAILFSVFAALLLTAPAMAEDVYSERTMELAAKLQCPVCAGQAVSDSQVTLAQQMREVIEQKVQAGETDEQILGYFTARYGENVLLEPPRSGFNLTLWIIPPVVLAVGALVVFLYLREGHTGRPQQRTTVNVDTGDEELEAIAREYLSTDANGRRT